jgi:hypothetical protein
VLMAAIATEVKVKSNLVARASDEQRAMIEWLLSNQREITVTAVDGLFDKIMKAAQGRSLRDEDANLFQRVKTLFRIRNTVAHEGKAPELSIAQDAVRAAREAIAWIEGRSTN